MATRKMSALRAAIARAQISPEFRDAMREYKLAGHVDTDGDVVIVPTMLDELVLDLFRRSEKAGPKVIFVFEENDETFGLRAMSRAEVVLEEHTMHMPFGTTVRQWFDQIDSVPGMFAWGADGVPDFIPESLMVNGHAIRSAVSSS